MASYRTYEFLRIVWEQIWPQADPRRREKFESLMELYDSPMRHYHTAEHLRECLSLLYVEFNGGYTPIPSVVARDTKFEVVVLALFYHDAVQQPLSQPPQPGPDQGIALSAALFLDDALGIIDNDTVALVDKAIRLTDYADKERQVNPDCVCREGLLVQDLDLNIFGWNPERGRQRMFEYEKQIWLECSAPSPAVKLPSVWASLYHGGRVALIEQLHHLAVHDQLFKEIRCKANWNDNARQNLSYLLGVLQGCQLFGR